MKPTALLLALLLSGCALAPRYERPKDLTPDAFRDAAALDGGKAAPSGPSFGDLNWWQVFNDKALQALIRQGIEHNYDIRIAAQRVIEAQAQVTTSRAGRLPSLTANVQAERKEKFQIGSTPLSPPPEPQTSSGASANDSKSASAASSTQSGQQASARDPSAGSETVTTALSLAWELDFWGRLRSANKSARAQLLATEAGRQAVIQSVVTGIAQAYLGLREYDMELSIAKSTLVSRQKSLRLVQARKDWGVGSQLDVRQSEALVAAASVKIPDLEAKIAQQENQISILIGAAPGSIARGGTLDQQQMTVEVPAGLPSALLDRRPDIREAEQRLIAANANVGEARAAYFPQITLTAALGTLSPAMAGVFQGPAGTTSLAPTAAWPLFNYGKVRAGVLASKAKREESLLTYRQTVQQALREVADALIGHTKAREVRAQLESLVETWREASRLSQLRYKGGVTSYLEVLDSERQLFDAELNLAQGKANELLAVVTLYKALGGGWDIAEAGKPVKTIRH